MQTITNYTRFMLTIVLSVAGTSLSWAVAPTASVPATPAVELIGVLRIDGTEHDLSGLQAKLEDGSSADQFGGLSAIEYSGKGDRFLLLPDRGAGDGEVSFPCRLHEADLVVDSTSKQIHFNLVATKQFTSAFGEQLVGSLSAHDADLHMSDRRHWTAFDPEGIRRLADGTFVISDEYGPHVVTVDESAHVTGEYEVPEPLRVREPVGGEYVFGTYPNRGLEGIAVTPSGATTIAVLQSPLIQDAKMESGRCLGLNCRWLLFNADHQCERELVYQVEDMSSGVSEILAVDEHRFLVLERDGGAGEDAKIKKIFLADIHGASDVTAIDSLPQTGVPADVRLVRKTLYLDLLDERFGLGGKRAHEKPEGLCWGKPLQDGRRTLWVCCDNDFDPSIQSEFYCFAVSGL